MKLSESTRKILKNYADIQSNILIRPGNKLCTVGSAKNVFSECVVAEDFPVEIGIFDLNKFLSSVSLFKDPDIDFKEKYAVISEGGASIRYFYADPTLLTTANKQIKMPNVAVTLSLSNKNVAELLKAANVLNVDKFVISSKDGFIFISVLDTKDNTSNHYEINVGPNKSGGEFRFIIKTETLKLLPFDYEVQIAESRVAQFKAIGTDLTYWVSLESDSTWKAGN